MIRSTLAGVGLALLAGVAPARGATFDFLYVESNVGTASGGHAAIRFGDTVYHYQNQGDGTLRLLREDYAFFRYAYGVLENRTLHASRIEVSEDTYGRLRDHFDARQLIEEEHFEELRAQRGDVELIRRMRARRRGDADARRDSDALALRGAGFFFEDGTPTPPRSEAPALVRLRERVRTQRGASFLATRSDRLGRALRALAPATRLPTRPPPSKDRLTLAPYGFSQRFVDLALERLALDALIQARPLRVGLRRAGRGPEFALEARQRASLRAFARRLETQLVQLLASPRSDRGYALLVGMARLQVLDESLRSGRLVVLDAFPARPRELRVGAAASRSEFLAELRDYARAEYLDTRGRVLARPLPSEREYNAIEDAANRYLEIERGIATGRDVRVHARRLVPYAAIQPPQSWLPTAEAADLEAALAAAQQRERASARELEALYGYDLIRRNCVSEIFDTINGAFGADELAERLGGRVDTAASLAFIPFIAFETVNRSYRVSRRLEIPSYRKQRLAQMYAREGRLLVYLREASTLTSTVYRRNPHDAFFLFFTDDAVLPRPLFGALNLAAGLGEALVGLLRLPFDGGDTVASGAKGAFFSLPELAFFNIRKGSLDYGRRWSREPGGSASP